MMKKIFHTTLLMLATLSSGQALDDKLNSLPTTLLHFENGTQDSVKLYIVACGYNSKDGIPYQEQAFDDLPLVRKTSGFTFTSTDLSGKYKDGQGHPLCSHFMTIIHILNSGPNEKMMRWDSATQGSNVKLVFNNFAQKHELINN